MEYITDFWYTYLHEWSVAGLKRINSTESKFFLGSLYPLEDGRCYGYLTNTQIKFFVITRSVTHEDAVILRVSTAFISHKCKRNCWLAAFFLFFFVLSFMQTFFFYVDSLSLLALAVLFFKVFERLHDEYVKLVCNPFFKPDTQITAKYVHV